MQGLTTSRQKPPCCNAGDKQGRRALESIQDDDARLKFRCRRSHRVVGGHRHHQGDQHAYAKRGHQEQQQVRFTFHVIFSRLHAHKEAVYEISSRCYFLGCYRQPGNISQTWTKSIPRHRERKPRNPLCIRLCAELTTSLAEIELVGPIIRFIPVAEVEPGQDLLEGAALTPGHLHSHQDPAVSGTVVAVVKH